MNFFIFRNIRHKLSRCVLSNIFDIFNQAGIHEAITCFYILMQSTYVKWIADRVFDRNQLEKIYWQRNLDIIIHKHLVRTLFKLIFPRRKKFPIYVFAYLHTISRVYCNGRIKTITVICGTDDDKKVKLCIL